MCVHIVFFFQVHGLEKTVLCCYENRNKINTDGERKRNN